MASTSIHLRDVDSMDFIKFFKDLLASLECIIIEDSTVGERLELVAVDKKRTSMWTLTMMNLFGGFLRKRIGIEVSVDPRGKDILVELDVKPYLGELDIEAHAEKADVEKCEGILGLLVKKTREQYEEIE